MGVFSEMDMEIQKGADSPFEENGAFGETPASEEQNVFEQASVSEQAENPPVMAGGQVNEETELPVPRTDVPERTGDMGIVPEQHGDEYADNQKAQADEEEEKRRAEHEAAEIKRKADWEAAKSAKKAANQEQLNRLTAMSDTEVMEASAKRVRNDTERLTRRNMKECVSEFIQTLCFSDCEFARLTMQPQKTMIHCFYYINRKAMEFLQQEMEYNGTKPEGLGGAYGGDVPDDLCYQWAEEYFRDPNAEEDKEKEEAFVPKPYVGKSAASKTKSKKAEKKPLEKKPEQEVKKALPDGQMSLLDLAMDKSA